MIASNVLILLYRYRVFRKLIIRFLNHVEKGEMFSVTWRELLKQYHGIEIGAYSYGDCMKPGNWPSGVTVGRYVSVGANVKVFLRNHPYDRLSMHPFFYNSSCGYVTVDNILSTTLSVKHDVWIGSNVTILPGCERIGIGAVVGAGAVVTKNVPDFAVVAGNPCRIIKYRFSETLQKEILGSRWWEKDITDLKENLQEFAVPYKLINNSENI